MLRDFSFNVESLKVIWLKKQNSKDQKHMLILEL